MRAIVFNISLTEKDNLIEVNDISTQDDTTHQSEDSINWHDILCPAGKETVKKYDKEGCNNKDCHQGMKMNI